MRLQIIGASKSYGATHALHNVHLGAEAGEIHALLGENGAGKSTLVKLLSGAVQPDAGEIRMDGRLFAPRDPTAARALGVSMIYQESTLLPHLSGEENITLGSEPAARHGWLDRSLRHQRALRALSELHDGSVPLDVPAGSLPAAQQQLLEIARAWLSEPKVLILDEPTRSLAAPEVRHLFEAVRRLAAHGVTVLYISHFPEESLALCSHYTLLRDGENVASGAMAGLDRATMIRLMAGRDLRQIYPRHPHHLGKPILELKGVGANRHSSRVDLVLREGEVFGLTGLEGSGRTGTLRTLFGLNRLRRGEILLGGRRAPRGSPPARLRWGMGMLSGSRQEENLLLERSIADNLTLPDLNRFGSAGFVSRERQVTAAADWMAKLHIRGGGPLQRVAQLSGGNRQKVALARLLRIRSKVLLLDEPTRGIDLASKTEIYNVIAQMAAQGNAILWVSSYLPELLGLCDQIGVMREGDLAEIRPASQWSEPELVEAVMGRRGL